MPLLEDFVGCELDAPSAAAVSAHLAGCEACSAEVELLRRENEIYARYERDVEVTPELWEGVWARIQQEAAPPRPSDRLAGLRSKLSGLAGAFGLGASPRLVPALSALALAVVAAGVTLAVFQASWDSTSSPDEAVATTTSNSSAPAPHVGEVVEPPTREAPTPDEPAEERTARPAGRGRTKPHRKAPSRRAPAPAPSAEPILPGQLARKTEQRYLAVIAVLARDIEQRLPEMRPETRQRVDTTIAELDRAIEGTRRAVAKDPSDPVAVQYMLAAYAKKVEVLQEVASR
jgi:hypothetical protein